jgi:uncharacterized peroxidase-related enzyme
MVDAALADWRTAPLDARLTAMLGFLEKMTLAPESLTVAHVRPLRDAGLSDAAIEDAVHVCALFNVYDRLADSFEFNIPDESSFAMSATMLLKRGYDF